MSELADHPDHGVERGLTLKWGWRLVALIEISLSFSGTIHFDQHDLG